MVKVEIDEGSGFCFGVVTAINKAEEELANGGTLYCLGDIVHNSREVERLKEMGLITINHDDFNHLHDAKVLLRAHGEPPETYEIARRNNIEIIDATCPVVRYHLPTSSQSHSKHTEICRFARPGILCEWQEKFQRKNVVQRMQKSQPKFPLDRQR